MINGFSSGTLSIRPSESSTMSSIGRRSSGFSSGTWSIRPESSRLFPTSRKLEDTPGVQEEIYREGSLRLPIEQQDKSRAILLCDNTSSAFVVSMYGYIDRINRFNLRHHPQRFDIGRDSVQDACLYSDWNSTYVLLALARENNKLRQLVAVQVDGPGNKTFTLDRPWNSAKKCGVSAVTTMIQPSSIASGGFDHSVQLWDVSKGFESATVQALNIKHNSVVQSLLSLRDTSQKLISAGADCAVNSFDVSSERVVSSIKTSNSVYHVHRATPFCLMLEVAHRELQVEIRDYRSVPVRPVQRFGFESAQLSGRFLKGSSLVSENLFACGDRNGKIRVWDLRNVASPCTTVQPFEANIKVTRAVLLNSRQILALSEKGEIRTISFGSTS
ncbi:WD40-repeat-containing domain protein [Mycena floridula]|nr:WD40-repeat-containing domain protein [Mycena floridula]